MSSGVPQRPSGNLFGRILLHAEQIGCLCPWRSECLLDALGRDGPGATALTVISVTGPFEGEGAGKRIDSCLGCRGVGHQGPSAIVQGHRNGNDPAAPLRLHQGVRCLTAVEGPIQVGLDHGPPCIGRQGRAGCVEVAGGVVDQDVQAAMVCQLLAEPSEPLSRAPAR